MKRLILLLLCASTLQAQTNVARMLSGVNYQTGLTYTFVPVDTTRVTQFNNAGSVAVTLPAGTTFGFGVGATVLASNVGLGTVTITCSGCTINGGTTVTLTTGQSADIYSDGVNYIANQGAGSSGCLTGATGNPGLPFWSGTACTIDITTTDDGTGDITLNSLAAVAAVSGTTLNASTTLNVGGTSGVSGVMTMLGGGTPSNPPANNFSLYGNTTNNNLACINSAGAACMIASIQTQNGGGNLVNHVGPFNVNCSTGMSCTDSAGTFTLTATISTIANIQVTNPTTAISANTCVLQTAQTMTGVTTTMVMEFSDAADNTALTGWGSTGGLVIHAWPTANTMNWKICNQTASSITPGAATFNVGAH